MSRRLGTDPALETAVRLFGPEFGHGKPFDLARLRGTLVAIGAPHEKLPPTIHVAGTNGKGSTIAFMRAVAEAAGLKVHVFTKPHLFKLNERFLVGGEHAGDEALSAAFERVAGVDAGLTQFDAQVAAAFLMFASEDADIVLLETGMGGREDSTNVVSHPALSVITPIALDHQDVLGERLGDIAAHKAGIMRGGVPAVVARQPDEARLVIESLAETIGAPLHRQGVEWDAFETGGRLVVQTASRALDLPLPNLHGAHQVQNAGLACVALLQRFDFDDDAAFATGIASAQWQARLQPLTRGALSAPVRESGGEVWVDGGHNAHAARALSRALESMRRKRPCAHIAVVGLRARKDVAAFLAELAKSIDRLIAVPLREQHADPEEVARLARAYGISAEAAPSLGSAMQDAAQFPAPRVLICGSLLLAAEALEAERC